MADMRLSTAHTESLLATMVSGVEVVLLGAGVTGHGDSGSVRWPGRLPEGGGVRGQREEVSSPGDAVEEED